jgi:hypothetical protein
MKTNTNESGAGDVFVPDAEFARELGVTLMSIWRYDHDPQLVKFGWPAKVTIRKRNFRSRNQIEKYKATMLRSAMARRSKFVAALEEAE